MVLKMFESLRFDCIVKYREKLELQWTCSNFRPSLISTYSYGVGIHRVKMVDFEHLNAFQSLSSAESHMNNIVLSFTCIKSIRNSSSL